MTVRIADRIVHPHSHAPKAKTAMSKATLTEVEPRKARGCDRGLLYSPAVPYIEEVPPHEATGAARREYEDALSRAGRIWNIVSIMSPNGQAMRDSMRFYGTLMFKDSPLTRSQREMIAVVTSQVNECPY